MASAMCLFQSLFVADMPAARAQAFASGVTWSAQRPRPRVSDLSIGFLEADTFGRILDFRLSQAFQSFL
jgi:hypothetical protein